MDVTAWLRELGLDAYIPSFQEHHIDIGVLKKLTPDDLKDLGVTSVGHRRKLLNAIAALPDLSAHTLPPSFLAGTAIPMAERRHMTVLFSDLVRSTALAAQLDPEDMRDIIGAYQNCCAEVISGFGGQVAKFMGDGVLAYFGFPRTHEHDAERAVRAGLALVDAIDSLELTGPVHLRTRVGIATGLVVIGDLIGTDAAKEVMAVGDSINLAARLQSLASPGTVVIASGTRDLLGRLFQLTDLGLQRIKGFPNPVAAWQVTGESLVESRFEAFHGASLTPLTGRDRELDILLAAWDQARTGKGQVVLLSGEAGVGKSRLLQALQARLSCRPPGQRLFYCSPYHQGSALYPFIAQLRRAAGLKRDEPADWQIDRLKKLLARKGINAQGIIQLIAPLLSIPVDPARYPPLTLSPQRRKARTLDALVELLTASKDGTPILMVFEDAHWSDPTSLGLLETIAARVRDLPICLLITVRPDAAPPWAVPPRVTVLPLERLGREESAAMVNRLTGGRTLPAEVLSQIISRADGIPLFVEEVTKAVLASDLLQDRGTHYELAGPLPELAIPATLQDSLMAQLDQLALVKQVAQIGAVIGREFSYELLSMVASAPDLHLRSALDQLLAANLIHRSATAQRETYAFKHALVRDAAYESLLRSRRRQLHEQIARILVEQFTDIADAEPELLAHHYTAAGINDAAIEYWQRAGIQAMQRSANTEAIGHFRKAVELLAGLPPTLGRTRKEIILQTCLGVSLMAAKGYSAPEVRDVYARAHELCRNLDDAPSMFPILFGLWAFYIVSTKLPAARDVAAQCLTMAQHSGDEDLLLEAYAASGSTALYLGDFGDARTWLEKGLALYTPQRHHAHAIVYGQDPIILLGFATRAHALLGYPDLARQRNQDLCEMAGDLSSHPNSLAAFRTLLTTFHLVLRDGTSARVHSEAVIACALEQDLPLWLSLARMARGAALVEEALVRGDRRQITEGIASGLTGMGAYRAIGAGLDIVTCLTSFVAGYGYLGQPAEGLRLLNEALRIIADTGERCYEAEVHRLIGELNAALPEPAEAAAEAAFRTSLDIARRQQAKLLELRAATGLARLWRGQGRSVEAHDLLAPLYAWFTEGFDTLDLRQARALCDELAKDIGAED